MTDLKDKAINIKGKQYVLVSDRILAFNNDFQNGSIKTDLISAPNAEMVVVKAVVTPDMAKPERSFTGYSQAKWGDGYINKTSALENAETSAVGRALAMMGIGVIDSIASVDEINKAEAVSKGGEQSTEDPEWMETEPLKCEKCGKQAKVLSGKTKAGKAYKGVACNSGDKSHTKWLW
jgi:hypothetical protein